jgi:hypothetical protein
VTEAGAAEAVAAPVLAGGISASALAWKSAKDLMAEFGSWLMEKTIPLLHSLTSLHIFKCM